MVINMIFCEIFHLIPFIRFMSCLISSNYDLFILELIWNCRLVCKKMKLCAWWWWFFQNWCSIWRTLIAVLLKLNNNKKNDFRFFCFYEMNIIKKNLNNLKNDANHILYNTRVHACFSLFSTLLYPHHHHHRRFVTIRKVLGRMEKSFEFFCIFFNGIRIHGECIEWSVCEEDFQKQTEIHFSTI